MHSGGAGTPSLGRRPGQSGQMGGVVSTHGFREAGSLYHSDLFAFLGWEAGTQACSYKGERAEGPAGFSWRV